MRVQFTRARSMGIATPHGAGTRTFAIGEEVDINETAAAAYIAMGDAIAIGTPAAETAADPEAKPTPSESTGASAETPLETTSEEDKHATAEKPRGRGLLGKRRTN